MGYERHLNSKIGRPEAILCGSVLIPIALLLLIVGGLLLGRVFDHFSVLYFALFLILLGAWLFRVALRLLSNKKRTDGGLFSPTAISVGAFIFALGGVLQIILGFQQQSVWPILLGGTGLATSMFTWRLAARRKQPTDNQGSY